MKTRKFRKSMLSAVVILMAAVLSLTGATYAWFTAGENAEVGAISATVEQGSGLLISTDGTTWVSSINYQIGQDFILEALSTDGVVGKTTNGQLDFYRATLDTTSSPSKITAPSLRNWTAKAAAADNESVVVGRDGFIAFDVYFNNIDQTAKSIKVTGGVTSNHSNNTAIRVAYIDQGHISGADSGLADFTTSLTGLAWDGTGSDEQGGSITIFEPFATTHLTTAYNEYKANVDSDATANGVFSYKGIAGTFEGAIDRYDDNAALADVTTVTSETGVYDNSLITLPENTCVKITVVVWLEGQDADCLNANSGGEFTLDIGFTIAQ